MQCAEWLISLMNVTDKVQQITMRRNCESTTKAAHGDGSQLLANEDASIDSYVLFAHLVFVPLVVV